MPGKLTMVIGPMAKVGHLRLPQSHLPAQEARLLQVQDKLLKLGITLLALRLVAHRQHQPKT